MQSCRIALSQASRRPELIPVCLNWLSDQFLVPADKLLTAALCQGRTGVLLCCCVVTASDSVTCRTCSCSLTSRGVPERLCPHLRHETLRWADRVCQQLRSSVELHNRVKWAVVAPPVSACCYSVCRRTNRLTAASPSAGDSVRIPGRPHTQKHCLL